VARKKPAESPPANATPRLEYMDLPELLAMRHPRNPKSHDIDELIASFKRFGFIAYPTIDERTGMMVAGHGRCEALAKMKERGDERPRGVMLGNVSADDPGDPRGATRHDWAVPVVRGISFESDAERDAYLIADNAHVMRGGWNVDALRSMLEDVRKNTQRATDDAFAGMGFDQLDLQSFGVAALDAIAGAAGELTSPTSSAGADVAPSSSDASERDAAAAAGDAGPREDGKDRAINVEVFGDAELADATFAHYREAGFPYPDPPLHECMQEINRLASMPLDALVKTTVGYGTADKFQRHRFEASAESKLSPYASFMDDEQLKRAIGLSLKYDGSLTDGAIRGVISLVRNTQACSNFRPGFAAYMYRRFCPAGGTVLDTSTGYGGRLVGALASTTVGHYIGIDPNTPTVAGNRKLLAMLGRDSFATLIESPAEDVSVKEWDLGELCDFAFTSPPYFRKEHYSESDTQSWKRYPTPDGWREGFLVKMMQLTFAALKRGSHAAINIGDVLLGAVRHPLGEWTVEAGRRVGFRLVETLDFPMSRRFGSNQKDEVASEPVFVFVKP
jgi:hypothetical protein